MTNSSNTTGPPTELADIWLPVPADDPTDRKGYRWPASSLTRSDMQKLTELRTATRRPISVLLHEAVSVLYELTQSDMAKLEQLRNRTGFSVQELLGQAIHFLYDAETSNDRYAQSPQTSKPPLRLHDASLPPTDGS